LIFAAETIRCIKFLGLLCGVGWMLKLVMHILNQQHPLPSIQSMLDNKTLPPELPSQSHTIKWDFSPLISAQALILDCSWLAL
jgi:hypothetical protein